MAELLEFINACFISYQMRDRLINEALAIDNLFVKSSIILYSPEGKNIKGQTRPAKELLRR